MRGVASLGVALLVLGSVASPAMAGPMVVISSSPVDFTKLTLGQQVTINVNLQGLDVGNDFIFVLNSRVLFPGSQFMAVPDPSNGSGLTPGPTFFFAPSQVSNFNALSSLTAGSANGDFSDSSPNRSFAINENGHYYSFILKAISVGSGSLQFDPSPGANQYADDTNNFGFQPLPTGGPLAFTISAATVPEPSAMVMAATSAVAGLGYWWLGASDPPPDLAPAGTSGRWQLEETNLAHGGGGAVIARMMRLAAHHPGDRPPDGGSDDLGRLYLWEAVPDRR